MIEGLKPYAEYKESGLPWLDSVPKHWDMAPNRALMRDQRQVVGSRASDYTLLSLTLRGVIARDMVNPKGKFPAQFNTYKVVNPDDFVFCLFDIDETPRGVGLSPLKGMITGAYDIFTPTNRINPRFLYHYYLFVDDGKLMKPLYTGLRKTIQRGVFASLKAPLPPPDEQAAIVRFLGHANLKIDGFIRAKRKLIGLLNEQKQAIIYRAVTRGLNLDAHLKPSGIPWLGDIPVHWEQHSLWTLTKLRTDRNPGNLQLLSVFLDRGVIRYDEGGGQVHAPSLDLSNYQVAMPGDLVLNNQQAWRGSVGVSFHHGIISPAYIVLKLSPKLNPVFTNYMMRSRAMVDQFVAASKGVGDIQRQVFWPFLRMIQVPVPNLEEQGKIVDYLTNETRSLNTAITRTEREIALIQEYRTRLTADIVTGKLDVREAAAKLPVSPVDAAAEPAPDELLEEIETEEIP
jgi:type I restriction enzyme S subunit